MLQAFNALFASVWALALLCIALALPFLALWFALSIRRDLHSIAQSMHHVAAVAQRFAGELDELPAEHYDGSRRGVFNSMFGR